MSQRLFVRTVFFLLAAAAFGLVAGGLILGEVARINPCHLCILQRVIYLVFGIWAMGGAAFPRGRRFWCVLLIVTAIGGLVAAGEQSWMQYAPDQVTECGFGEPTPTEQLVNWLGMQWPALFMVTGFCTQKDWIFLGLSLANWSILCFLLLLLAALWLLVKGGKRR